MLTLLGIFIIITPYILLVHFSNKYLGFAAITAGSFFIHLCIGFGVQALHIFSYPIVLSVHLVVLTGILMWCYRNDTFNKIKKIRVQKIIVGCLLGAGIIVGYQLYSVHFNYTGLVNTTTGQAYVVNDSYPYPLFSDEWIAVAVVQDTIAENRLPFTNPFVERPLTNFLFAFHIFLAELSVLLHVEILYAYAWFSIAAGMLAIAMLYAAFRSFALPFGISLLGVFLLPFVTNSSNLPMLWYLLPWNIGFIFFVAMFIAMRAKKTVHATLLGLVALMFYPPLLVFLVPSYITYVIWQKVRHAKMFLLFAAFLVCVPFLFAATVSFVTGQTFIEVLLFFGSKMIRPLNSALGVPPTFYVWDVLPFVVTPFAFWGLYLLRKTHLYIVVPATLGFLMWLCYGLIDTTILVDFHRIVAITSLLLMITAMFGLADVWKRVYARIPKQYKEKTPIISVALLFIIFLVLTPGYTKRTAWADFTTTYYTQGQFRTVPPAAPVNRYFHQDDITMFEAIDERARFIAPGWKGLIIGTLTDHRPLFTKPATITLKLLRFNDFNRADCEEKRVLMEEAHATHSYGPQIACDGFTYIGKSTEELHLYTYTPR